MAGAARAEGWSALQRPRCSGLDANRKDNHVRTYRMLIGLAAVLVAAVVQAQTTGTVDADPGQLLVMAQMPARDGVTTDVVRALDTAGIRVTDVTLRRSSLDDVFMILTGHQAAPEHAAAGGPAGEQAATGQGGAAA